MSEARSGTTAPHADGTWLAPAATGAVRGVVALPGSKSITNRALVLAALADGRQQDWAEPAHVDAGNAGTVLRFVPPVATLAVRDAAFDGDPRARERPVGPLITALRVLGAAIDDDGRGALPFVVHGRGALRGGAVTLDASGSSQLVSALL